MVLLTLMVFTSYEPTSKLRHARILIENCGTTQMRRRGISATRVALSVARRGHNNTSESEVATRDGQDKHRSYIEYEVPGYPEPVCFTASLI